MVEVAAAAFAADGELLFFFFLLTALSHWDFSHGQLELLSLGKASCDRVALPNLRCTLDGILLFPGVIHRTLTWTTGSSTCVQMLMHVIAHGGFMDTVRV